MQIILLQDVDNLGLRGDVVSVADGYARNFLVPRRLAERATAAKVAEIHKREEIRARQEARTTEQAQAIAETLSKTVLRFELPAGPTGRLFGSVTPTNVADELWRTRKVRVDRRKIALHDPIKRIGRYAVPVEVFQDVVVEVKTLVVPEGGELPPEEELAALEAEERAEEAAAKAEAEGAEPAEELLEVEDEALPAEEMTEPPAAEAETEPELVEPEAAAAEPETGPEPEPEPEATAAEPEVEPEQ
jgi:large subunit ribosomal protein L9